MKQDELRRFRNKIRAAQKRLEVRAAKNGICENFGHDEVSKLSDCIPFDSFERAEMLEALDAFSEWAMTYTTTGKERSA